MKSKARTLAVLALLPLAAMFARAERPDPRTPAGQLAVCGGATSWKAVGYLEFEVKITNVAGVQGPYRYRWDRRNGLVWFTGPSATGSKLDVALDLGTRTGGAWEDGTQLTDHRLTEATGWAVQRFGEHVLWLTFPLEWGAAGVTVTPLADATGSDGKVYPAVEVKSPAGVWRTLLDPASGRVLQTPATRRGGSPLTEIWEDWRPNGGVLFAAKHTIVETGQTVDVAVYKAQPEAPRDAF